MMWIENLQKMADDAQKRILEVIEKYGERASETVKIGAYGSPSSRVDVEAEKIIVDFVKEKELPLNIFSEEIGYVNRGHGLTLIVDPLDGSYNAENNIPFYSVSLAISEGDLESVKYALVRDVHTGKDYRAVKGEGAYLGDEKIHVKGDKNLFIIYLGKKAHESAFKLASKARRIRSFGSASLELCMVAQGIADLFLYRFSSGGALRIVDIAAAYLIVKEAGGLVLDENLHELNMKMNTKERKNVVAVAKPSLLEVFS